MQKHKLKILVFVDWFLPGFKAGGPIRSCTGLVERLNGHFNLKVVTGNTDLNETIPYQNVISDEWNTLENGAEVFYLSQKSRNFKFISEIIKSENPDLIYLNSMFSFHFTMLPLLALRFGKMNIPVVIAPRGMLSKGALTLKPLKKKLFLSVAGISGLFKHAAFHASTNIEVDEIKSSFGSQVKVNTAMNLTPKVNVQFPVKHKEVGKVMLAYIGRVSEVKNLLQCLKALSNTSNQYQYIFDLYGTHDDPAYLQKCMQEINSMPLHVKVSMKGNIDNKLVGDTLQKYHFFFMLTMNENYGHAIVEAFTAACPVIISDRTPWRDLEKNKCGWDLSLNSESNISHALHKAASMNNEEYNSWSRSAFDFAMKIHENPEAVADHVNLFENAIGNK